MNTKTIEYVIVVHGIGEQRPNETVLPVINRFAEVRQQQRMPKNCEVVSLGMISSQSGKPEKRDGITDYTNCQSWSEFKNIPAVDDHKVSFFLGDPSYNGDNIRFVDMNWADIMSGEFGEVGQPTEIWADTLLDRLEMKEIRDKKFEKKNPKSTDNAGIDARKDAETKWVLPILYQLEETLVFLKGVLSVKTKSIADKIFDSFLGDVQLYGEYLPIRGKAVRRFHGLMNKIEREHIARHCPNHTEEDKYRNGDEYVKPRYTIIAHSLGTVMSTDMLMYAHMEKSMYEKQNLGKYDNLPFPEYAVNMTDENARNAEGKLKRESYQWVLEQQGEYLGSRWIDNVANFVTLGSPVDKFLVIWWQNYQYFKYINLFKDRETKIKHFNYCDEQDPVGHLLDYFSKHAAYEKIFSSQEDIVYNRYAVPGKAHVDYWTDYELFYRIVKCCIDNKPVASFPITEVHKKENPIKGNVPKEELSDRLMFDDFSNKKGVYHKVMWYCYGVMPLMMTVLCSFLVIWVWEAKSAAGSAMAALALIGTAFLFRRLIKISIWWRQILKAKNESLTGEYILAAHSRGFKRFCNLILLSLVGFCLLYIPSYFALLLTVNEFDWQHHVVDFSAILGLGLLASFVYHKFLYKPRTKGKFKFGLTVDNVTIFEIFLLCATIGGLTLGQYYYSEYNILQPLFMKINFISTDYAEALGESKEVIKEVIAATTPNEQVLEKLLDYQRENEEDEQGGYVLFNVLSLLGFTATCVWMFTLNCLNNATREVRRIMKNQEI